MLRLFRLLLIGASSAVILAGCAGSSAIVAKIGNEPLTLREYEESFAKNNGGWEKASTSTMEDREKFLDLLVNFRLKVMEARNRGLMSDSTIRHELEGYEVSVATSYALEKEIVEPKIKEAYNRRKEEVRASQILIKVDPNASPADTLAAYEKAMKVIGLVPTTSFDTLAVHYSDDPSASYNRGDTGFFTSGRMVPEFEAVAYALEVGDYTRVPIRSQYGYHIAKVTGRQPNRGPVRVSHILRRFRDTPQDSTVVKDSVRIIYRLVKGGMDFAQAARKFSEDPGVKENGGDIGYYERGRVPANIEAVFYNTPLDSITEPVQMPYGYHIFKITGYKGIPSYLELEKELRDQYNQMRYNNDYAGFVRDLGKVYHVKFDTTTVVLLMHAFDSTMTPANWTWADTLKENMKGRMLFTCEGRVSTVSDFVDHVNASAEFKSMPLAPSNVQHMVARMSESKLVEEHARLVPNRYPAFQKLLKEYEDGILLYRIEQDEVWKKIVVNDSLLHWYFRQTRENYRWPARVDFQEILVTSDSLAQAAYKEIQEGKDFGEVAEKYTMRQGYKEKKGMWGLTPYSQNEFSRYAAKLPIDSIPPPFAHPNGWSIIKVLAKDTSHVKEFQECVPEIMSAYQEYAAKARQEAWIADLKARYGVVLNKEMLSDAFKRKPVDTE
jgi:peptidyl-prolyl cis-trans isomerase SurA